MGVINGILTRVFGLFFGLFQAIGPIWALTVISFLTGILMLWIFGKVSDQDAIRVVRDRIRGNLLAIRLFGDDLLLLARLQGRILRQTLTYLKYALIPLIVMLVPVLLILTQVNLWFDVKPLEPGERTLLKAKVREGFGLQDRLVLEAPDGVVVETPGVRVPSLGEVVWRIRADEPGDYKLTVRAGEEAVDKQLLVGSDWRAVSALRTGRNLWEIVLYPGEAPIDSDNRIQSVQVDYPRLPLSLFGWNVHWLVFFFIASLVFGFAFRRVLGVEI